MAKPHKHSIRLVYKSGYAQDVEATSIETSSRGGEIVSVSWTGMSPRPIALGINDLAAVFQLCCTD